MSMLIHLPSSMKSELNAIAFRGNQSLESVIIRLVQEALQSKEPWDLRSQEFTPIPDIPTVSTSQTVKAGD